MSWCVCDKGSFFLFHFKRLMCTQRSSYAFRDAINDRWLNHVIMPKMNRNDNCHHSLACQNVYLWYHSPYRASVRRVCRESKLAYHTYIYYDDRHNVYTSHMYIVHCILWLPLAHTYKILRNGKQYSANIHNMYFVSIIANNRVKYHSPV